MTRERARGTSDRPRAARAPRLARGQGARLHRRAVKTVQSESMGARRRSCAQRCLEPIVTRRRVHAMPETAAVFVEWGSLAEAVSVKSLEELDALLDDLECLARSTAPFLVVLADSEGSSLTIGVGRDESIAQYSDGSDDGLSFSSIPVPGRKG